MSLIKLTGLWKSQDKNGNTLLTGKVNGFTSVMIMTNQFKKKEEEPDYYLYFKNMDKKPENKKGDL